MGVKPARPVGGAHAGARGDDRLGAASLQATADDSSCGPYRRLPLAPSHNGNVASAGPAPARGAPPPPPAPAAPGAPRAPPATGPGRRRHDRRVDSEPPLDAGQWLPRMRITGQTNCAAT